MIPARIRLTQAPITFTPGGTLIHRVSLAWWDPDEPEGRREPVLVLGPRGARTVVVVWPTDGQGYLNGERTRRGEVEILPWDLDDRQVARIGELARMWPLDRHDLLVGRRIDPTPECLRLADLGIGLDTRIEAAIRKLM